MSFVSHALSLPGAVKGVHPLKPCSRCQRLATPEGGIDMGPRWICAACWIQHRATKPSKTQ